MILPYPPSCNKYWRQFRGRAIVSKSGRRYKTDVAAILMLARPTPFIGRISVTIIVNPPDNRRRDIDNILKATLDACNGFLWLDDSQIDELHVVRGPCVTQGQIEVLARPLGEKPAGCSRHAGA